MAEPSSILEDKYAKTHANIVHIEKQLDHVDHEMVEAFIALRDQKCFEDHEVEELKKLHELWYSLFTMHRAEKREIRVVSIASCCVHY